MTVQASLVDQVRASGSSFYWAIRLSPAKQRRAMAAIYVFCRAVDDIADGNLPANEKRQKLQQWKECLSAPKTLCPDRMLGAELADAIEDFALPLAPFVAIVDGCEMDLPPGISAPSMSTLKLYCRRVAGAVGELTVLVSGVRHAAAVDFALASGEALQLTNILRDVTEDARLGRCYLPREMLADAGIDPAASPTAIAGHDALPSVCAELATVARQRFDEAWAIFRSPSFRRSDRRHLGSAMTMLAVYRLLLRRLERRGWNDLDRRPRLGPLGMLGAVLRYRVLG